MANITSNQEEVVADPESAEADAEDEAVVAADGRKGMDNIPTARATRQSVTMTFTQITKILACSHKITLLC